MGIKIISRSFINSVTGAETNVYKANAGDKTLCKYRVTERIEFQNDNNVSLSFNYGNNAINATGINLISEGFLNGDLVTISGVDTTTGTALFTAFDMVIVTVNPNQIVFNGAFTVAGIVPSLINQITISTKNHKRNAINLYVNHVEQGLAYDGVSHIDGEKTRLSANNIAGLALSTPATLTQFGFESGQFAVTSATITKENQYTNGANYLIEFNVIQSGGYDSTMFANADCLQLSNGFEFFREYTNPNTAVVLFDDYLSYTGYFNEAFNGEPFTSVVTSAYPTLYYNAPTTFNFTINSVDPLIGIGGLYVPQSPNQFKNILPDQSTSGMIIHTQATLVSGVYASTQNSVNAEYELEINSLTSVGTLRSGNITFTPNFNGYFDNLSGDRLFRIWIKVNDVNHLIYEGQLLFKDTPNTIFTPDAFQVVDITSQQTVAEGNNVGEYVIEDNLAMLVNVAMNNNETLVSIDTLLYYEGLNGDTFVIQQDSFDVGNSAMVNGQYQQTLSIQKNYNLSTGSSKNIATLTPNNTGGSTYSFDVNYPFLIDWKYWLSQPLAPQSLFPNQNKNWIGYYQTGSVYMQVRKVYSTHYEYTNPEPLVFSDYNSVPSVTSGYQLYRNNYAPVFNVLDEQMIFQATFNTVGNITGEVIEVTIEPFESSPRWQICTLYGNTNQANPLTIISQSTSGTNAQIFVAVDTTKIDISNGVKFTAEIKGLSGITQIQERTFAKYDYLSLPSVGFDEEEREDDSCCEIELKVASSASTESQKNDKTGVVVVLSETNSSLTAKLYKSGQSVAVETLSFDDMPNEEYGKISIVDWRTVLLAHGQGCYRIEIDSMVSNIPFVYDYGRYQLLNYDYKAVKDTVRVRSLFNKYSTKTNINYEDSDFVDDFRFKGFFGNMQPKTEVTKLTYTDRVQRTILNEDVPTYELESEALKPEWIDRLMNYALFNATTLKLSNYNKQDPVYYSDLEVIISEGGEGIVLDNFTADRKRALRCVLEKKELNLRMFKK